MAAVRFSRKGITKFYFVPTIASKAAPTVAEITAGTDITPQISAVEGFTFTSSPIAAPDLAVTFTAQVPGEDTAADSTITFYELKGGTDTIHDALDKGLSGYLVIFPAGLAGQTPAAADKCEVWPVTIGSNARQYTADNEAAKYQVSFSVNAVPNQEAAVAA